VLAGLITVGLLATPVEASKVIPDSLPHTTGKAVAKPIAKPPREHKTVLASTFKAKPTPKPASSGGDIELIVRQAARKYGIDEEYFLRIARCESTLNPRAVNTGYYENGHPSGLFQHLSGYYKARAEKYGYSPDVFEPYSNANVTAAMFAEGHSNLWECN
jgi:soluble lytic murein transglycosylase-like protein